jgi:hypothetical protein
MLSRPRKDRGNFCLVRVDRCGGHHSAFSVLLYGLGRRTIVLEPLIAVRNDQRGNSRYSTVTPAHTWS